MERIYFPVIIILITVAAALTLVDGQINMMEDNIAQIRIMLSEIE